MLHGYTYAWGRNLGWHIRHIASDVALCGRHPAPEKDPVATNWPNGWHNRIEPIRVAPNAKRWVRNVGRVCAECAHKYNVKARKHGQR